MKKFLCYFSLLPIGSFLFSCSNTAEENASEERNQLIERIDSISKKMFDSASLELNRGLALKGIEASRAFLQKFPDDSLAPEYLFRMSDLLRAAGDNKSALETLARICVDYPGYKKIPECLFLQGYYFQEYFNDTASAKYYYVRLIDKYPNHAFADDARILMSMFGKSEEEIIRGFEQKEAASKK